MSDPSLGDATSASPEDIEALAAARAEARRDRDFGRADELKARIESAGWKVVDDGSRYTLMPTRPPDRVEDGRIVYGSVASVPSRLDAPARPGATAVLVVGDLEAVIASAAAATAAADIEVVIVAPAGSFERTRLVERLRVATAVEPVEVHRSGRDAGAVEVLWTTEALAPPAALVAGLRRVGRELVIVLEPGVEVDPAVLRPIVEALADPSIAVVGTDGLASEDLHRFTPAGPGAPVVALGPSLVAFRRSDASRLEAIDGRIDSWAGVVAWSSLALREGVDGKGTRHVMVVDVPIGARPGPSDVARRDRYRISARFGEDDALRV